MKKIMTDKLIECLLERKAINKGTTHITANIRAKDLSGNYSSVICDEFTLRQIVKTESGTFFVASRTRNPDLQIFNIPVDSIQTIDGMEPEKLAEVYNLKLDGSKKELKICPITGEPIRRGRKPKWVKAEMARRNLENSDDFDDSDELDDVEEFDHTVHA